MRKIVGVEMELWIVFIVNKYMGVSPLREAGLFGGSVFVDISQEKLWRLN